MELLKLTTEWAKSEVFSTRFFIIFAIIFLIASIGFWQLGKTDLAKAYVLTTLTAGILLMTIGLGLFYTNKSRVIQFEKSYNQDTTIFYQSEIDRSISTLKEYGVVFKVLPILIIISTLIFLYVSSPTWKAISITAIGFLFVLMLIDGLAYSRMQNYHEELKMIRLDK